MTEIIGPARLANSHRELLESVQELTGYLWRWGREDGQG